MKYLELSEDQLGKGILWGEEHTDFNLLTLLPGGCFFRDGQRGQAPDDGGGLFLRTPPTASNPSGALVRGKAPEGCVVAQVGQQLEVSAEDFFGTERLLDGDALEVAGRTATRRASDGPRRAGAKRRR